MTVLVSVYIPTQNRCALLEAAVRSVLAQEFRELELVVVDDASTDLTPQLLESLAASDPRVRFFRNDRVRGASASRNTAIEQARGMFVTGLDDDDEFCVHRVGALLEFWSSLSRRQVNMSCIFTQDILINDGCEVGVSQKRGTIQFPDLFEANHIGNQIFAPKTVFEGAGLFNAELPAWQDLEFLMRVTKQYGVARLLDLPLYRFDVTPTRSRISTKQERVRRACEMVSRLHCEGDRASQLKLLMQVFSSYYGFRPTVMDVVRAGKLTRNPKALLRMSSLLLRTER